MGAEFAEQFPEDRRAARDERPRGRRSLRRAAARGRRRSWPRASSSSSTPSSRASRRRCSRSSTRTTWRRRRRCSWPSSSRIPASRIWPPASRFRAAARCRARRSRDDVDGLRVPHGAGRDACGRSRSRRASYFSFAPDLPLNALPVAQRIKGGLRIRLKTTAGLKFHQTSLDRLCLYLAGRDDVANAAVRAVSGRGLGALVAAAEEPGAVARVPAGAACIRPVGFADDEALLPVTLRSFQGYRLLQEYFSFPQRFRFVELSGLAARDPAIGRRTSSSSSSCSAAATPTLERVVDASNFALFCTPAINLFHKRADRIHVSDSTHEYHVVPDRTRPHGFRGLRGDRRRRPRRRRRQRAAVPAVLRGLRSDAEHPHSAYFTTRREPRLLSATQKRRGTRSSYIGTRGVPLAGRFRAGAVRRRSAAARRSRRCARTATWRCRCRSGSGRAICRWTSAAPVASDPRRQRPEPPVRAAGRRGGRVAGDQPPVAQLPVAGGCDAAGGRRRAARSARAVRGERGRERPHGRSRASGPCRSRASCAGCRRRARSRSAAAWRSRCKVDELAFEGGSAFLLGAVLERFFARYVSINSFTETVLRSDNRGRNQPMGAAMGRETDALALLRGAGGGGRTATTSTRRCGGSSACSTTSRAGARRCGRSTSPCASGRSPIWRSRRRRSRRFSAARDGEPPRLQVQLVRPARAERSAAAAPHRVRARAPAARRRSRRSAASSTCSIIASWRSSTGPGRRRSRTSTGIGPPTIASRPTSARSWACRRRRSAIAMPFRISRSSFMRERSCARCATPRAWARCSSTSSGCRCDCEEFVGHWMALGPRERTRLGQEGARLGLGAVLGGSVWDRQHKFRVGLGPLTLAQYEIVPAGRDAGSAPLVAWVSTYLCFELDVGRAPGVEAE